MADALRTSDDEGEVTGIVDGINDQGEVLIDGTPYAVGDVHHLRPSDA